MPFELCLLLKLFKPKAFEWPLLYLWIDILLLVPNTFYMITDLIHLNQFQFNFLVGLNLTEWVYYLPYVRRFLSDICYDLIFMEIGHLTSHLWLNRTLIIVLMFLNGLGIYIGRF